MSEFGPIARLGLAARRLLRGTPLLGVYQQYKYRSWLKQGRPLPSQGLPRLAKEATVKQYARQFGLRVFIETGTYLGDMVQAVCGIFDQIYSIELSEELYSYAKRKFARTDNVAILHGDSGEILGQLLKTIDQPCLFWLDGHYSSGLPSAKGSTETPISAELTHISQHVLVQQHVILIDDARLFTGAGDYPDLDVVRSWATTVGLEHFEIHDDIIRIHNVTRRAARS